MNADHTQPSNAASALAARAKAAPDPCVDASFDAHARACHGASLQRLSARAQARLAQARHAGARPAPRRSATWAVPAVFGAVAVLAVALRWQQDPGVIPTEVPPAIAASKANAGPSDPTAALDENPDFYLWLASTDVTSPSSREY